MAKVKIQGNASGTGTVTLTAPNTNNDRTITLPDGDVTMGVGIVDNANATAITIDSSEQVGVGAAPSDHQLTVNSPSSSEKVLELSTGSASLKLNFSRSGNPTAYIRMHEDGAVGTGSLYFGTGTGASPVDMLKLMSDGRGLSQFTAKAWVNFNGTGTVAIRDSHNVSSITDNGTGDYTVSFSNNMANNSYSLSGLGNQNSTAGDSCGKTITPYAWEVGYFKVRTGFFETTEQFRDFVLATTVIFGD